MNNVYKIKDLSILTVTHKRSEQIKNSLILCLSGSRQCAKVPLGPLFQLFHPKKFQPTETKCMEHLVSMEINCLHTEIEYTFI